MIFERQNIGFFITFIIVGAILGSASGRLIANFFPALSVITGNLTGPIGFNLEIISFSIKLNLSAIIGIIIGIIVFRKV